MRMVEISPGGECSDDGDIFLIVSVQAGAAHCTCLPR